MRMQAVVVSSLKFSKYSARKKLINSSVGKPVSFEHHVSVEAFSGVSLTVVFMVPGGGVTPRELEFESEVKVKRNGPRLTTSFFWAASRG